MMETIHPLQTFTDILNGLVRPLLAIMFGAAIVYMAIAGAITSGEFLGMAAVVIGFFFQSRQAEKALQKVDDLLKANPV